VSNLEVIPNHHLEHKEELSIGNISIPVHIIHLERDCPQNQVVSGDGADVEKSGRRQARVRTAQLLLPPTSTTKRAQATDKLLKVDGAPATGDFARSGQHPARYAAQRRGYDALFVENGDHPRRERVVCDLRNREELVSVDRAVAVAG